MVKILLVEDEGPKCDAIQSHLDSGPNAADLKVDLARSFVEANQMLTKTDYDLVLLDIRLPIRTNDSPQDDGGLILLKELHSNPQLRKPKYILGLTAYEDILLGSHLIFEELAWTIEKFDFQNDSWKKVISRKIDYFVSVNSNQVIPDYDYDFAIVTALHSPELSEVLKQHNDWKSVCFAGDSTEYNECSITTSSGNVRRVVAAAAPKIGMVASSILTAKICSHYNPRIVMMAGIAAGVASACNLGDILIADTTWDYNSGKIVVSEENTSSLIPSPQNIPMDPDLHEKVMQLLSSGEIEEKIQNNWGGKEAQSKLKAVLGPIGSGAAVIQNPSIVEDIRGYRDRKLIGIEMEGHGVAYAAQHVPKPRPKTLIIKSACDYADHFKNDNFQGYAAYTSGAFVFELIRNDYLF